MRPRVLWVEDSARLELSNLAGPVYFSGEVDFNLAEDATSAARLLLSEDFDVLIVDVRLPPGSDPIWSKHYRAAGADKVNAQLGLKLLYWLLGRNTTLYSAPPPTHITPEKVSVFTVENRYEIQHDLEELGVELYFQKVADLPDTILLEIIERVLRHTRADKGLVA